MTDATVGAQQETVLPIEEPTVTLVSDGYRRYAMVMLLIISIRELPQARTCVRGRP